MSDTLETLLTNAVQAVIDIAVHQGITEFPQHEYTIEWMEPETDTSSRGKRETRKEPAYRQFKNDVKGKLESAPAIQTLNSCATEFAINEGKYPFHFPKPQYAGNAGELLLDEYFFETAALTVNSQTITKLCTQFINDLRAETIKLRTIFQVQNFSAEVPFELEDGIRFRPVTMNDADMFARVGYMGALHNRHKWLDLKDWICKVEKPIQKTDWHSYNYFQDIVNNIALGLNLSTAGAATFFILEKSFSSPFFGFSRLYGGSDFLTSRHGVKTTLAADAISKFQKIFLQLQAIERDPALSYLKLPLRRLRAAAHRQESEDHLIDCVIALERLLAPDTQQLEITFRFQLRGAALLPDRFGNANARRDMMKKLYSARSDAVHGKASSEEVSDYSVKAEDVLREILLWYLAKGTALGKPDDIIKVLDMALITGGASMRDG